MRLMQTEAGPSIMDSYGFALVCMDLHRFILICIDSYPFIMIYYETHKLLSVIRYVLHVLQYSQFALFVFTGPYGPGDAGWAGWSVGRSGRSVGSVGSGGCDKAGGRSVGWAGEALSQYRRCDEMEAIWVGGTGMRDVGMARWPWPAIVTLFPN
jgi:hypothetical protein